MTRAGPMLTKQKQTKLYKKTTYLTNARITKQQQKKIFIRVSVAGNNIP